MTTALALGLKQNIEDEALFPIESFHEAQSKLIDRLIPDIAHAEKETNINSALQFDDLLTHLEISFKSNMALTSPETQSFKYTACPSADVFRVLFTLASRSPNTNWTMSNSNVDGIVTSNEMLKSVNVGYDTSLYRTSLNERSLDIIRKYIDLIIEGNKDDFGRNKLYSNLREFLADFVIVRPSGMSGTRSSTNRPQRQIKSVSRPASSPTKRDIMSIIRESPRKKRKAVKIPESDLVVISDSEAEESLQLAKSEADQVEEEDEADYDSNISAMEEEVQKYQEFGLSINNKTSDMFDDEDRGKLKNPFLSLNNEPAKRGSPKREKKTEDKWDHIKIFDEPILSKKLKPTFENEFTLWKLVNWAMYCAGKDKDVYDSTYRNYHLIYCTQASLLICLFSIIEYNLVQEISKIFRWVSDPIGWCTRQPKNIQTYMLGQLEASTDIFLPVLMSQLTYFKRSWFDRLVEYVFNGFSARVSAFPATCYEHEKLLVRRDGNIKVRPKTSRYNYYNDLMDSMKLRYKIISMVYYWSCFFDLSNQDGIIRDKDTSGNSLLPYVLIQEVANRFLKIESYYLEEFFQCLCNTSCISFKYRELLLINLAQDLLEKLTNSFQLKFSIGERVEGDILGGSDTNSWRTENLRLVINWLKNEEIYNQITEDETYPTFAHFNQAWLKLNFLLGWMLALVLRDAAKCRDNFDRDALLEACEMMDKIRIQKYKEYLTQVAASKFDLSKDDINEKQEKQKWEDFATIVKTTF